MSLRKEEFLINVGPQHPSTHGVFRVVLSLEGEKVVSVEPHIGYLHRGVEKIAENRTYHQFIPYTDRLDYVGAMLSNWGYVRAVEKLAEIEVPRRAEYLRVIVGELQRIASHLIAIGTGGMDAGGYTFFLYAFREREEILRLFEKICGARLTYSYFRFGGVSRDIKPEFEKGVRSFLKTFPSKLDEYRDLLFNNPIFLSRTKGVGVLPAEIALEAGASGPVLRGSGVGRDLRKVEGYSVYSEFDFFIPTGKNGDSWDRLWVRLEEMRQSSKIVSQALDGLPEGSFQAEVPRYLSPPPGMAYAAVEGTKGELGFFVVSDGSFKPYRLKVRSPAYANLALLPYLLTGSQLADLPVILGSLDPVFGEVDR